MAKTSQNHIRHADASKFIVARSRNFVFWDRPISAEQIWQKIEMGLSHDQILAQFKLTDPKAIHAAESFIMQKQRKRFQDHYGAPPDGAPRIWLDECVPWHVGAALHKARFGKIRSVPMAAKSGTKDPELWDFFVSKRVDMVITKDGHDKDHAGDHNVTDYKKLKTKHLTTLARKTHEAEVIKAFNKAAKPAFKRFPFVLILNHDVPPDQLETLLTSNRSKILKCLNGRKSNVYGRLYKNGRLDVHTVGDIKYSRLEPEATRIIQQLRNTDLFPFEDFLRHPDYSAADTADQRHALYTKKKAEIDAHKENVDRLKTCLIVFAKATHRKLDLELAQYVLLLIAQSAAQTGQSPAQVLDPNALIRQHHALSA